MLYLLYTWYDAIRSQKPWYLQYPSISASGPSGVGILQQHWCCLEYHLYKPRGYYLVNRCVFLPCRYLEEPAAEFKKDLCRWEASHQSWTNSSGKAVSWKIYSFQVVLGSLMPPCERTLGNYLHTNSLSLSLSHSLSPWNSISVLEGITLLDVTLANASGPEENALFKCVGWGSTPSSANMLLAPTWGQVQVLHI